VQRHHRAPAIFVAEEMVAARMRTITNPARPRAPISSAPASADFGSCCKDDALNANELQIVFGIAFHLKA
jgi:hypothetical protein